MKFDKGKLLFNTISHLKFKQIFFRIYYLLRNKFYKVKLLKYQLNVDVPNELKIQKIFLKTAIYSIENTFTFLNISHTFKNKIDWNYTNNGKLWTYNLNYFDYLLQNDMSESDGIRLIHDYIKQSDSILDGFMPFPISLRGVNWIKFLSKYKIKDPDISNSLYAQYMMLMDNVEYHILGNHLLENGFSLLFGAYYYEDEKFYKKAKKILIDELEEQILIDGAHFELSPMYHQIMLFRVLDCINLVQNNPWKQQELLKLLISKAEIMLGWLNTITYENGHIPLLNDSAKNIAPTTQELNDYAKVLTLDALQQELTMSGYRKIQKPSYEMIIDVGNIGPDYIPGHAHSDTFNFELYYDGNPLIVDTGISTYETNERRLYERSTVSHNTVVVDDINQSEVWGGFRVARRAKVIHIEEKDNYIKATHDGYKRIGVLHSRKFITKKNFIVIEDNLESIKKHKGIAYLHFYPGILPEVKGNTIIIKNIEIQIDDARNITIDKYEYAPEFNRQITAYKAAIVFQEHLKMEITL